MESSSSSPNAALESTNSQNESGEGCGCNSSITISVNPTTGGQFDLAVTKSDTIENLKKLISKKLKVPKERICLLHRERQLRDGTVQENQLVNGSRLTLLPSVETGLLAQRPEQSVMQALESLNDSQVNDFLSGKAPLNLTMRLGDHMMLIQLQLSTVTPSTTSSTSSTTSSTTSPQTSSSSSSSSTFTKSRTSSGAAPHSSVSKKTPVVAKDPLASLTSIVNKSLMDDRRTPSSTPTSADVLRRCFMSSSAPKRFAAAAGSVNDHQYCHPSTTATNCSRNAADAPSSVPLLSSSRNSVDAPTSVPLLGRNSVDAQTSVPLLNSGRNGVDTPKSVPLLATSFSGSTSTPTAVPTSLPATSPTILSPASPPVPPPPRMSSSSSPCKCDSGGSSSSPMSTPPSAFSSSSSSASTSPSQSAAGLSTVASTQTDAAAAAASSTTASSTAPSAANRPTLDTRALAEASRNLTQTLKQLSSEVLTSKSDPVEDVSTLKRRQGAIIESMHHHGKGVYSGTFSGTLNPALQDRFGRPKRDISTIIHILNDLLCATPHYRNVRNAHAATASTTPTASADSQSPTSTAASTSQANDADTSRTPKQQATAAASSSAAATSSAASESLENQATRGKMERLRLIMEERREKRRAARATPYSRSACVNTTGVTPVGSGVGGAGVRACAKKPNGNNGACAKQLADSWSAKSETQPAPASDAADAVAAQSDTSNADQSAAMDTSDAALCQPTSASGQTTTAEAQAQAPEPVVA